MQVDVIKKITSQIILVVGLKKPGAVPVRSVDNGRLVVRTAVPVEILNQPHLDTFVVQLRIGKWLEEGICAPVQLQIHTELVGIDNFLAGFEWKSNNKITIQPHVWIFSADHLDQGPDFINPGRFLYSIKRLLGPAFDRQIEIEETRLDNQIKKRFIA